MAADLFTIRFLSFFMLRQKDKEIAAVEVVPICGPLVLCDEPFVVGDALKPADAYIDSH